MMISSAKTSDITTAAALIESFYLEEGYEYNRANILNSLKQFTENKALGEFLLISCDNKIAGYAIVVNTFCFELGGKVGYIDELFILKDYRGKKLATRLLEHIISTYSTNNFASLRLEVERANPKAAELYTRIGFEKHNRDLMTMLLAKTTSQ